ncbi:hypothetical protein D3C81_1546980 [compost metagenome]
MGGRQRHAQLFGRQHHHHAIATAAIGKEFGMANERHAGVVDDALVHRAGDQRGEFTVQTTVAGTRQGFYHVGTVTYVQLTRYYRMSGSDRQHRQGTRPLRLSRLLWLIGAQLQRQV